MKTLNEFLNTNKKQLNNYIDTINLLKEIFEGFSKMVILKQK